VHACFQDGAVAGAVGGAGRLTRDESLRRKGQVERVDYALALTFAEKASTYRGAVTIDLEVAGPTAGLFLDFQGERLLETTLDGQPCTLAIANGRIDLSGLGLSPGRHELRIAYDNDFDHDGSGCHQSKDPADGREYVFTDFEPFNANKLFPCFDQPDLKATYAVTVTAPEGWEVVANGRSTSVLPSEGGRTHVFERTARFSTYVLCICAGPWAVWTDPLARIPSRVLARRSMAGYVDADEIFTLTRQGFDFFERYFDIPYPYHKYDQIFVPDYNVGAMENVACVVHSDRMIYRHAATERERRDRAVTILHEMAHMWFGDLVTMEWWDDLWLNESFATYMATLALVSSTRFTDGFQAFRQGEKRWAYWQDELPTTHPIATDVPDTVNAFTNFDGITYGKGASVLKQLSYYVGPDAFRAGVSSYLKRHAHGNARLKDFLAAIGKAAGKDLDPWAKAWIRTSGVNGIAPSMRLEGGRIAEATLTQSKGNGDAILRPHRLLVAAYGEDAAGAIVLTKSADAVLEGETARVPGLVGVEAPRFLLVNHDDHAYAKASLDPLSLDWTTANLERLPGGMLRTEIWSILWNMVRDQQAPPTRYVDLFVAKAGLESDDKLLSLVVRNVKTCLDAYVPEGRRDALVAAVNGVAAREVRRAPAGTDLQKLWFEVLAITSETPASLGILADLAEGTTSIPGLTVDLERRWMVATRLCAHGHPRATAFLDAQRKGDATERGERAAFRCEASRPDASSKQAVWTRFTADPGSRLDLLRDGMAAFHWAHQRPILAPYVQRFFQDLVPATTKRDLHFGSAYVNNLFPFLSVDPKTLDVAQGFLDGQKDLPAHLRRALVERTSELDRALKVRATVRA